ncbi:MULTISPECIES: DUF6118 family protein [Rhizobium/Agrobacterium group]|uniref:DUF6118 family protein n=1 Tax=Rhizobium/Agrobacterium group TaxID=227290 RepID=UPI0009859081|nr:MULTISPECIES: DUF6118 family protein [Rhizobium/Agrobacterium group]NTA51273.1 hypothetical protein [Agrobacterium tumefaciens]TIX93594.1 hypothetical protein BSK43_000270 [Rhizobium sp. P44RR-XXIV]
MTDDDRNHHPEDMEPEAFHGEDDAGDPAAAFEALRDTVEDLAADLGREMTTIRKGVESAFDQLERQGATVDYSAELGRMTQQLTVVGEHLQAIQQVPILRQGAEHYARVLERSGEGLVRSAAQKLENRASDLERISRNLSAQVEGARERGRQDRWLIGVGLSGVALGILFTLFGPAVLPFSAAPRVASVVMGEDAWNSGMELMRFGSPASWERVSAADRLIDANSAAITACRKAVASSGKPQACSITVTAGQ